MLAHWLSPPRVWIIVFLLAMLLPACAVTWLGFKSLEQDRLLETKRVQDHLDAVADRAVISLQQSLAAVERSLAAPTAAEGALRVEYSRSVIADLSPSLFKPGEDLEFGTQNYAQAIASFRQLAASTDPSIRAGALLRIARNLRKTGNTGEALRTYEQMARLSVIIDGVPAEWIARRARCRLFEELHRREELRQEAGLLATSLQIARFPADRASFVHYAGPVTEWLGQSVSNKERFAAAGAAAWLYDRWNSGTLPSSGRLAAPIDDASYLFVWSASKNHLTALVLDRRYQLEKLFSKLDPGTTALRDSKGEQVFPPHPLVTKVQTQRGSSDTGLPWTVAAYPGIPSGSAAANRRILLGSLATLLLAVTMAAYFLVRAFLREMAVARQQSEFVAAVSHEFRTPLTALRQFNELLDEETLDPAQRRSFLQAQTRATDRLHRLVESLLDLGRMEAGARPYRLAPVEAGPFVSGILSDFRKGLSGFTADLENNAGAAIVEADAEALGLAIWNLLDNAIKYSNGASRICISVEPAQGKLRIAIRDFGYGIPASEQKAIFRKFVRGEEARKRGIQGTGVGLAIVSHIVQAHHGSLQVESTPDKGSTFTISIPLKG